MIGKTLVNIIHVEYMDNIQQSIDTVNKVYNKAGYFDLYGGSVLFCIFLILALAIFHLYQRMMLKAEPIRRNWVVNRCKPTVIPFAGNIMRPTNMSWIDFTGKNFNACMNSTLEQIIGYFVQPIQAVMQPIINLWKMMLGVLQEIRKMFTYIRAQLANIFKDLFTRIENIMPPMQRMIVTLNDMLAKIQGVFKSGIYMVVGVYYSMMSFFGIILTMVIILLIALAVLIILLWFWPWWWGIAAMMTVTYLSIMVPLLIMVVFFRDYFGVRSPLSVPPGPTKPSCFGPNTPIQVRVPGPDKGQVDVRPIYDIAPGDELENGDIVTAKLCLATEGNDVYELHGIFVTGDHHVIHNDVWLKVKNHPDARIRPDYSDPYVYCLNVSSKHMMVGADVFADWDELHEPGMVDDFFYKATYVSTGIKMFRFNNNNNNHLNIHRQFDGGLVGTTSVAFPRWASTNIDNVVVGDVLANGARVTGVVSVLGSDLNQATYDIAPYCLGKRVGTTHKSELCGGPNNVFMRNTNTNQMQSTLSIRDNNKKRDESTQRVLFHLITDLETFPLSNGCIMCDYSSCVDFLNNNP